MTIRRGEAYGATGTLASTGAVARSDAEASALVAEARRRAEPPPMIGLLGGDLCRTLGGEGDESRLHGDEAVRFPVDLAIADIDGVERYFLAHLIVRGRWWRGRTVAPMNAQWLGDWDLGPRSHPNDGLLDVSDGALGLADRLAARSRVRTGTHLPHPAIATSRVAHFATELGPGRRAWIDGVSIGPVRTLSVRVEPDAVTVVV